MIDITCDNCISSLGNETVYCSSCYNKLQESISKLEVRAEEKDDRIEVLEKQIEQLEDKL